MTYARTCTTACGIFLLCIAATITSHAQTFTTLATFNITDGDQPVGALAQGLDGNFYGTTRYGGRQQCFGGCGTIFKITPEGTLTTLYELVAADIGNNLSGQGVGGLVLATNGNFYGTTTHIAFEITPSGGLTVLNSDFPFDQFGSFPNETLVQDTDSGNFYGTTEGSVFAMTPSGSVTVLKDFCDPRESRKGCYSADGYAPNSPLVWDGYNGLFYGTTSGYDPEADDCCGTVFVIGKGGSLKTLYRFTGTDGAYPLAGLIQGADGNFYGTTSGGGQYDGSGTVFKITPEGAITTLYSFCSNACGHGPGYPLSGLVQASDGNFYGTTLYGTPSGAAGAGCLTCAGTVFKITPGGTMTTIYAFCTTTTERRCTDGLFPDSLTQGTDGNLYGTTMGRLGNNDGTIFKISLGLPPFVKTLQPAAHTGAEITILGTDLTDATSVTFNGASAVFTVVSATEIKATVPADATTGTVEVTTPGGTLKSNLPFRVYCD